MSGAARGWAVYGIIASVIFLGAFVAGFVYGHEPVRDTLVLTVDRDPEAARSPEVYVSGIVRSFDGSTLVLTTEGGEREFVLPQGAGIEQLVRMEGDEIAPGDRVNVGGEHTQFGLVLTGVVRIEGAP